MKQGENGRAGLNLSRVNRSKAFRLPPIEALELRRLLSTAPLAIPQVAGSVSGNQAVAVGGYNLTSIGSTDWIHWGRGGVYGATDRDKTGGQQISTVTVVGSGANVGGYENSSRLSVWTNGTPTAVDENETGYIWENGALNTGYSFTVPADTTSRTLQVDAGGYGTAMSFRAHLSDGSAADYVATASGSGTYTEEFDITYNAASAGQTLTITLLKTGNITGTQGSVDLIAAMLQPTPQPPPSIPAPPDIYTSQSNDESGNFSFSPVSFATSYNVYRSITSGGEGSTPYKTGLNGTYFNDTGLTDGLDYYYEVTAVGSWGESAKSNEIFLSPQVGPAYIPNFDSAAPGNTQATLSWTQDIGITDTYNIYRSTTPGGEGATPYKTGITGTTYVDTGLTNGTTYYYEVQSVRAGNLSRVSRELAVRPVGPTTPIYGSVSGQQSVAAASYNLTQLGASDWVHWADEGSLFYDDRKSTGGGQISNVSLYGIPFPNTASDPSRDSIWTDGTNTAVQPGTSTYLLSQGVDDGGFTFTAPADTTTRTLYVYAGGDDATTTLRAHLSDASAADYVATATGSGIYSNFYTISYKAASAGHTLTILLVKTSDATTGVTGSADLIAAALAPGAVQLSAPAVTTNPQSQTAIVGATVNFTAAASGTPAPAVQWMVEPAGSGSFSPISGATSTTLNLGAATLSQSGNEYEAVFSNGVGSPVTTTAATLTVNAATSAPTIIMNPTSQTVTVGQTVTFTAAASGNPTPTVQWEYSNGRDPFTQLLPVPGATSPTLSFTATAADSGYDYQALFSNGVGTAAITQYALLTVNPAPSGGSLSGATSNPASSYNLTSFGTSDWAHWGTGVNASAFDDKATGGSQISNVTRVGSGSYGAWSDPSRTFSWTDGTPLATDAGDDGYLWANTAIGAGYSFTVPASTAVQTLDIFLGGYSSGGTLTAHLSDASAPDYTASFSGNALYNDLVTITFQAASAGQKLTLTWAKSSNINGTSGSVDLASAWLVGTPLSTPPAVTISPSSQSLTVGQDAKFSAAATGVPSPTVQWMVDPAGGSSFSPINGATSTTLDLGAATLAMSGNKYEAVFSNGIGSPATTAAATLTVTPAVTPPAAGSLSGVSSVAASSYSLTTLGTSDWAHWGVAGNATAVDHKATGGSQISSVKRVGSGSFGAYTNPARAVSWTDGTPLASNSGDDGYLWANTGIGAGYTFTVPAGITKHTVYVYLGGYSSGSTLTAHLSDGSAADYVVNLSGSGSYANVIAITYNAASAGQTLTLTYVKSQNINGTGGSADLMAAWLQ